MKNKDFPSVVELIRQHDSRYGKGVYFFIRQALDYTVKAIKKKNPSLKSNHISGQDLLEGIRKYAIDQYGPMAHTLLKEWNVKKCEDFGNIVFNLVEFGVLGKTESDKQEDFEGGYDFHEAFVEPYLPKRKKIEKK
jgi:uncharacterized repeat protein (TIGR04138 family)